MQSCMYRIIVGAALRGRPALIVALDFIEHYQGFNVERNRILSGGKPPFCLYTFLTCEKLRFGANL